MVEDSALGIASRKGREKIAMSEPKKSHGLRVEAKAVKFHRLSKSQVEAAEKITNVLCDAYDQDQPSKIRDSRRNHILMVSGDKGSGKTTLALSLRSWFEHSGDLGQQVPSTESQGSAKEEPSEAVRGFERTEASIYEQSGNRIKKQIENHRNIRWLDALSLDVLQPGTNLVAAVFARITDAVARETDSGSQDRGLLEPVSLLERALHELGSLRSDAVMALEGNLFQRSPYMDPESHAIAAIENEKKKLEIADRLNTVLRRLLEGPTSRSDKPFKGLYVLPVDDLDSCPTRAVEMLKLAYSLSVPRLVFLLLGSIDTADKVLFYQLQGEFRQLLHAEGQADEDAIETVVATANQIASSSLRKMIPPSQRIELDSLEVSHAKRFTPESATEEEAGRDARPEEPLEKQLEKVRFKPGILYTGGTGPASGEIDLKTLILVSDPFSKEKKEGGQDPGNYLYDGLGLLQTAPRQLSDLYDLLGRHESGKNKEHVFQLFSEIFRPLVDEDGALTPPVQARLKKCVERDPFSGDVELTPPDLRMVTETGDRIELDATVLKGDTLFPTRQIVAQRVRQLDLEAKEASGGFRPLARPTRSTFKVIHDLIRFTGAGVVTKPIPHEDRWGVAYTQWDDGVNEPLIVPWLRTDWLTFWHTDFFFRIWNRGLQRVRRIKRESSDLGARELSHLLGVIAAGGLVATAATRIPGKQEEWIDDALREALRSLVSSEDPAEGKWTHGHLKLGSVIEEIVSMAGKLASHVQEKRHSRSDDDEADQIDTVLVNLILLVAPECGIPWIEVKGESGEEYLLYKRLWSTLENVKEPTESKTPKLLERLSPQIRRQRLERLGGHASTQLGIALLNPHVANDLKNVTSVVGDIRANSPHFRGDKKSKMYCPGEEDLRQAFLRAERTKRTRAFSRIETMDLRKRLGIETETHQGETP